MKEKGIDLSQGVHKTAGYPAVGDDCVFVLSSGPNAGKTRAAKVVRVFGDPNSGSRVDLFVCDVAVFTVPEDGFGGSVMVVDRVEKSAVEFRGEGTWDWVRRPETGF